MKIQLVKGESLVIPEKALPLRLVAQEGTLWLTQTGNLEDIVLQPGVAFKASSGKIIIEALTKTASFEFNTFKNKSLFERSLSQFEILRNP